MFLFKEGCFCFSGRVWTASLASLVESVCDPVYIVTYRLHHIVGHLVHVANGFQQIESFLVFQLELLGATFGAAWWITTTLLHFGVADHVIK